MATPYVTPAMIANAPTGVPWSLIPLPGASLQQQSAEQTNMCWRASAEVDRLCNQPLRATLDTEEEVGPDFRLTVNNSNGVARMWASRWPVVQLLGGQVSSAAAFPPAWSPIPANQMRTHTALLGTYGTSAAGTGGAGPSSIDIAPGYVTWYGGRYGYRVQVSYINGWPHAGIIGAGAAAGASSIPVDDVTGFTGASAFAYDSGLSETISVTTVAATNPITVFGQTVHVGPGVINLAAPLANAHAAGVVVSCLPQDVSWATIMLTAAQALEAGIESVAIQAVQGAAMSSGHGIQELQVQAELILSSYHRAI